MFEVHLAGEAVWALGDLGWFAPHCGRSDCNHPRDYLGIIGGIKALLHGAYCWITASLSGTPSDLT